jgi:hypothetical protein
MAMVRLQPTLMRSGLVVAEFAPDHPAVPLMRQLRDPPPAYRCPLSIRQCGHRRVCYGQHHMN